MTETITDIHLGWVLLYETEEAYRLSSHIYKTREDAEKEADKAARAPIAIMQLYEWIQVQEGLRDVQKGEGGQHIHLFRQ